jgi:hypothetical protein
MFPEAHYQRRESDDFAGLLGDLTMRADGTNSRHFDVERLASQYRRSSKSVISPSSRNTSPKAAQKLRNLD